MSPRDLLFVTTGEDNQPIQRKTTFCSIALLQKFRFISNKIKLIQIEQRIFFYKNMNQNYILISHIFGQTNHVHCTTTGQSEFELRNYIKYYKLHFSRTMLSTLMSELVDSQNVLVPIVFRLSLTRAGHDVLLRAPSLSLVFFWRLFEWFSALPFCTFGFPSSPPTAQISFNVLSKNLHEIRMEISFVCFEYDAVRNQNYFATDILVQLCSE